MDLRKIKKLIEMVEASGISELEVRNGEESIRIARPLASTHAATTSQRYAERLHAGSLCTTRRARICRARAANGNVLLRTGAR